MKNKLHFAIVTSRYIITALLALILLSLPLMLIDNHIIHPEKTNFIMWCSQHVITISLVLLSLHFIIKKTEYLFVKSN